MKKFNKTIALLLVLAMCMAMLPLTAMAANADGVTYTATLDKATITTSAEAQQVVMTVKANKAFETDGMGLKVLIPEGWTLAAIENAELQIPAGEIDLIQGLVSYSTPDAENWSTDLIVKVTYNVPANVAAGTYTLGIQNLILSKDFGTEWESDGSASVTLTVNGAAHTCQHDHYDTTETTHQSVCACGQTIGEATSHTGGTATCNAKAKCATCGAEYGNVDKTNHVGETELRNAATASCDKPGYTGDTYCKSCNELITKGEEIPATGNHVDADGKWEADGNAHFRTCQCGTVFDSAAHSGGAATCTAKAKCEICGAEYGEVNKQNHAGDTEIRNAETPTCAKPGYSGDVHCKDCGEMIRKGQEIAATGEHVDADGAWEHDENGHFHTCGCGAKFDDDEHTGGKATCVAKAVCDTCGAEYGDVDKQAHTGEYVTHNVVEETCGKPGYTGDLHCKACETLLEKGEEIPATGKHTGGTATCVDKAICDVCGQSYGEVDPKNHVGEEELVDASEPTCVEDGYTGDIWCLSCDEMKVRGQILPATGEHAGTYRFTWDWDADHNECTLVVWFHCATCQSDVAFENVTDIGEVTKVATCSETGVRTYTFDMSNAKLPEKCTWDDFTLFNNDLGDENAVWNYETKTMTLSIIVPVDPNNHVGETEIRGAVKETCGEPGYTGDTHCKDCDAKIAEGKPVEPTGDHKGGTATCMACAVCEVCGQSYGELDPNNHAGDIIQKELVTKEPTCGEPGMKTVTDFCSKCMTPVNEKEVEIPATGKHTGGEATCTNKAVCGVCGKEYGEKNPDNHDWNREWDHDSKAHWHACDRCGEVKDTEAHYDRDNDRYCDACGYYYGSVPSTGDTHEVVFATMVMLLTACGAVLVFKKRRTVY